MWGHTVRVCLYVLYVCTCVCVNVFSPAVHIVCVHPACIFFPLGLSTYKDCSICGHEA